jgi:hypothetical protein
MDGDAVEGGYGCDLFGQPVGSAFRHITQQVCLVPQGRLCRSQAYGDPWWAAPRWIEDANDVKNSHTLPTAVH